MSDDIRVSPTPIQRNRLDVATELTQLHIEKYGMVNENYIKEIFTEYFSLVVQLERTAYKDMAKLKDFLPEDIKKNMY